MFSIDNLCLRIAKRMNNKPPNGKYIVQNFDLNAQ